MKKITFFLSLSLLSLFNVIAQEFSLDADLRQRFEYRHGFSTLFPDDADPAAFVRQRARLNCKYSAEKLYRNEKNYDIIINIKYNYSPVRKGKGSAIFLHLTNKKYKPTRGCIAIQKKDFIKIMPLIKRNTKILIK